MPRPTDVGVGVAVALVRGQYIDAPQVLFQRRRGAHGAGTWSFPGGWIDADDSSPRVTAHREVLEETGISLYLNGLSLLHECITRFQDDRGLFSSVTLIYRATVAANTEPQLREPTKCAAQQWFSLGMVAECVRAWRANDLTEEQIDASARAMTANTLRFEIPFPLFGGLHGGVADALLQLQERIRAETSICPCDEHERTRGHRESCPFAIPRL